MKMMQRDLGRTVEPDRHDARARSNRSVAGHAVMLPCPRTHVPRQDAIEGDGYASGQADLAAMGMAGEEEIEIGMCRLPVDFRCVREQDRERAGRNLARRLLDAVRAVEMRIVDAGEMNAIVPALDRLLLVEQHS
ncbi:MAG: hypothetical protein WBB50_10630, partial [Methyloceanibacter sp.]